MSLRNLVIVFLCAVATVGLGIYVYHTHPYVVWGLLALCWGCYRMQRRATQQFGSRQHARATVSSTSR